MLQRLFNYKYTSYWIEKSTTKAIAFVDKIDNMQRQIIKALGYQIDIEDPVCTNYAITYFHSIVWMFIAVIVTTYRNVSNQSYEYSHFIMLATKLLRSCI